MERHNTSRVLLFIIVVIVLSFAFELVSSAGEYAKATECIKSGEYEKAGEYLAGLGNYRDAETLTRYCAIMSTYNSKEFSSVYRCYHELSEISDELSNKKLTAQIVAATTEVKTIYENYNVLLCAN